MAAKKTKISAIRVGDVVAVDFLDHCEDDHFIECRVFGRVVEKSRNAMRICCWEYGDTVFRDDHNEKTFELVSKAITDIRKLK